MNPRGAARLPAVALLFIVIDVAVIPNALRATFGDKTRRMSA